MKKYKRLAIEDPSTKDHAPRKSSKAWVDLLRQLVQANMLPRGELYVGDGEEADNDEDAQVAMKDYMSPTPVATGPGKAVVEVPAEECKRLWRPWQRALIAKPLGRNVTFRVLSQRLTDMWALSRRIDIIDLEDGFYIVCFYSKEDYVHVLKEGPWTIQDHCNLRIMFTGFLPT